MDDQNLGGEFIPPVQQPIQQPQQQATASAAPASVTPPSGNSGKKLPLILGGVVLLIAVVLLVVKFVLPGLGGPKETTINWWGLWEDESSVAPLISEYESTHPGVKIKYTKELPTDYRERLVAALAQGTGPDIFRFHNTWGTTLKSQLDTAPSKLFNTSNFTDTYYPVVTSDLIGASGIIGIPLEYDALTLFVNDDIFTKAGKEIPSTWDELRSTALQLTIKDERGVTTQSGVAMGRTENVDHWPEILALLMLQNRANLAKPEGDLAEKALQFFTIFSKVDKVWDETLPNSTAAFAGGKLAMYFAPSWRAFEISQANPNLKFRTVPLPQVPKDSPTEPNFAYATYWAEGVSSGSKHKDEAWSFLKFMSEKDSLEKFYKNASVTRPFGEPYPRVDMASLLIDHEVLGSVIKLAPEAKSWYLASDTWDGPTGINTQINKYYEDAINALNKGTSIKEALATVTSGVAQVLAQLKSSK